MKRILSIAFILLITNVQAQEKNKLSLEHYKNYEWKANFFLVLVHWLLAK